MKYLRFSSGALRADTFAGFFQVVYELLREGGLDQYVFDAIEDELRWFEQNLPAPEYFEQSHPDASYLKAVCWFKDSAKEHLQHAWVMVTMLAEIGVTVDLISSETPGAIVWMDEYQILAKPWKRNRDGVVRT